MATSTARPSRRLSIRERLFHRKRVAKDAEKDDVPTTSDKLLSPSSIPAPRVPSSASLSSSNERGSVSMSATTLASRHGRSRRMRIPFYSHGKRASSFSVIKPQRTSASMSSSSPSVLTRIVQRVVPCVAQPFSPVDNPTAGNHAHPSLGVIAARAGATQSTLSPIQIPALSVDPAAPDTPASIAPLAHPTPDDPVGVTSASVQPVISPHSRDSTLFTPSDDTDASFTEYDPDDPHHAINSNPLAPSAQPGSSPTHPMPPPYGADLDDDDYPDDMQLHDDIDIAIHDDYDAALRAELAEEGRLIRNGGAGIPIGPVRAFVTLVQERALT
ncbi:hypothetical protein FISHEDRAFT_77574 [Fistulina hepatica ATCC 64428]|uniref:Uncharacterized protein n=1 Tax=Fistulina hepatica ATCC 64428 TaxID=1128425 RepID=A0A0D7A026_9AGAR|nr:hypothetical protein FISHEDRAFT_77574 [Fistulina hepatica ATCC 64428]